MAEPLEFQCLSFDTRDEGDKYTIRIFGKDADGTSVCVTTAFTPYFFVCLSPGQTVDTIHSTVKKGLVVINPEHDSDDDEPSDQPKWLKIGHHLMQPLLVRRKKFWGFENGTLHNFVQLTFTTERAWRRGSNVCKKQGWDMFEANISPLLRFVHNRDLQTTGWIRLADYSRVASKSTYCATEVTTHWKKIDPMPEKNNVAPLVLASFDIEAYSSTGGFPNPKLEEDCVFQIATCFQRFGEAEPYMRHLVNLGTCNPIEGVVVDAVYDEKDLLKKWAEVVRSQHADVLVGFNIWGFDFSYMWERAGKRGCRRLLNVGRMRDHQPQLKTSNLDSAAYGQNKFHILTSPGVYQVDFYVWAKREIKMESGIYKLDALAEHYLGEHKLDVTPQQLFAMFKQGPTERKMIGEYCVQVSVSASCA